MLRKFKLGLINELGGIQKRMVLFTVKKYSENW